LRHGTVGTVARAFGTLSALRLAEPVFLRRARGQSGRESAILARSAATYLLFESRLAAAAVLARGMSGSEVVARSASLAERALLGPVPEQFGAFLALRLSPGGSFRGKAHAFALAAAMRERFDEDWFLNPRAGEPLRGALARGGELSVESLAEELGSTLEGGLSKLSELF
jgi:hypothetical protein